MAGQTAPGCLTVKRISSQPLLHPGQVFGPGQAAWPFLESGAVWRCQSGRAAIFQACRALGVSGPGRVLVPAYHCGAEVAPYQAVGLEPDFYHVGADLTVDPERVAAAIRPRTKAVHLTHFFGFPGPAEALAEVAGRAGLPLIEDAAHGLFSQPEGRPLGSHGQAAIFSLTKALPVSDGGLLRLEQVPPGRAPRLKRPPLPHRYRGLRHQTARRAKQALGRVEGAEPRTATGWKSAPSGEVGFDPRTAAWRASPLSSAVLARTDWSDVAARRLTNYRTLMTALSPAFGPDLEPLAAQLADGVSPWSLPVRVRDPLGLTADLKARGVDAITVWGYFHPRFDPGANPEATDLKRSVIGLPIHQDVDEADCLRTAAVVAEVMDKRR